MVKGNRIELTNAWNGAEKREIGGHRLADRESKDCGHRRVPTEWAHKSGLRAHPLQKDS